MGEEGLGGGGGDYSRDDVGLDLVTIQVNIEDFEQISQRSCLKV